jgi:O-methyltransferase
MKSMIIKLNTWVIRFLFPGYHIVPNIYGVSFRKQYDIRSDEHFKSLADVVISEKRTYLGYDRLNVLYQAINQAAKSASLIDAPFAAMEVGVYRGGGSKFICEVIAKITNTKKAQFYAIDTFVGHAEEDITNSDGWHTTGTFVDTSKKSVVDYLKTYNFAMVVQARIQDCYKNIKKEVDQFWFIHIDVDIEKPTTYLLGELLVDLAVGGVIVIDDFGFESCPGLRDSVKSFEKNNKNFCFFELLTGQALLIKTSEK